MKYFIIFVSLCLGGVMSASYRDSNLYMDNILTSRLGNLLRSRGLNPAVLPNFSNGFFHKLSGTTVQVHADYTRGQLSGLQYVRRARDCSAPYWSRGNAALNCTLTFPNLGINYVSKMGYGSVSVNPVTAVANVTGAQIFVEVSTSTIRNLPQVSNYNVQSIGQIKARFINLGPMNSFQATLNNHFVSSCTTNLLGLLNNQFRLALADSVPQLTMPLP